jgi:single-stranded-DNA-specific exonuclease
MSEPRRWRDPAPLDLPPAAITGVRIVDEILARRGIRTPEQAREWLNPNLSRDCARAELPGMEQVLARISSALGQGESIRVFGDYDCDGVTSTAILFQALASAARERSLVSWELPTRDDGYGLRADVIDRAVANGVTLLIAVDCGSNDLDLVARGRELGLDIAVIDHHQITAEIPEDAALINPQRDGSAEYRNLTAAGLAYLVVVCLARDGFVVAPDGKDERVYLVLAAIGTVGDVGSLHGLNRAIVHEGVAALRKTRNLGLRALTRQSKLDLANATAETISFKIAPKLNAPGRMGSPDIALRLLLASDMDSAEELARAVIACDNDRRVQTDLVAAEVAAVLAQEGSIPPVIVLASTTWPPGLVGPVAAKVAEQHGRPAVILAGTGDYLSGSGRSVPGWDLAAAFQQMTQLLHRHGGHARAAGLSVERGRVGELRSALSDLYLRSGAAYPTESEAQIDADIKNDAISLGLAKAIERLGPFGAGNERPVLRWRNAGMARWERVGKDKSHAQLWLRGESGQQARAIYFGGAHAIEQLASGQQFDALVELSLGVWRQAEQIDLRVIDIQPVV